MSAAENLDQERVVVDAESLDWYPHEEFCRMYGKKPGYARGKIMENKWVYGEQWVKDPDGQIWVSIKGFKKWLLSNSQPDAGRMAPESKSGSPGAVSDMSQSGRGNRRNPTSVRRPVYELK